MFCLVEYTYTGNKHLLQLYMNCEFLKIYKYYFKRLIKEWTNSQDFGLDVFHLRPKVLLHEVRFASYFHNYIK